MRSSSLSRRDWLVPAALIVLALVPAIAGTGRLVQLSDAANATPENARFFALPLPVLLLARPVPATETRAPGSDWLFGALLWRSRHRC